MYKILATFIFVVISFSLSSQTLHRTACRGNLIALDSLLENHALDIKDDRGRSLLHWAVACKQDSVIHFLLEKGIDINSVDYSQETPMHVAAKGKGLEYFDLLIELQADDQWKNNFGASLFELSVLRKDTMLIKKLLQQGVDINSTNTRGSTALEISRRIHSISISQFLLEHGADTNKVRKFAVNGKYMGQEEPGAIAKPFAPNFISTEEQEFGSIFSASGTEFYFGVDVNGKAEIRYTTLTEGQWSEAKAILKHDVYSYNDPFLSPNEDRLYFISDRSLNGLDDPKDIDIWFVERTANGWSAPINAGANINSTGNEYYISFAKNGTMYFATNNHSPEAEGRDDHDIYYSKYIDNKFQEAVALGDSVNTAEYEADVFIDPEEKYIIFCSTRSEGMGRGDLYISFKNSDGLWSKSMNMGKSINTVHHELCPFVSKDGKYFFYTSRGDIYWISTEIILSLKANMH